MSNAQPQNVVFTAAHMNFLSKEEQEQAKMHLIAMERLEYLIRHLEETPCRVSEAARVTDCIKFLGGMYDSSKAVIAQLLEVAERNIKDGTKEKGSKKGNGGKRSRGAKKGSSKNARTPKGRA